MALKKQDSVLYQSPIDIYNSFYMSDSLHHFYREEERGGPFHKVVPLHESREWSWEAISHEAPLLPRGWYELSRLTAEERLEFTRDYWLSKLGNNHSEAEDQLETFFSSLEEVGIFVTQSTPTKAYEAHMVYIPKNEESFFHGSPPATKEAIANLSKQFSHFELPSDYLAFLEIHDGFCKYTDTGMIKTKEMARVYQRFQQLRGRDILIGPDGEQVDPLHLIPFYESSHLHCYQCFYADWTPLGEMGTVFYADEDELMNFLDERYLESSRAFPTFFHFLFSYLEDLYG